METIDVEVFVPADRAAVRAAFLDVNELARWWWPHLPDVNYALEPHPGGRYRIHTDTVGFGVHGEIVSLGDGTASLTWVWEDGASHGPEEIVTIRLSETEDGTLVTIEHICVSDAANLRVGWNETLAQLPKLFSPQRD